MRSADPALHARRRAEIIAAAEQCFLKRGFHQTSMQNIAEASALSMGLLYRYFANKEAIIEAVAKQDQEATLAAIATVSVNGDSVAAWVSLLIDMATIASTPDYAALASEIFAEANRSPGVQQTLRDNDAGLTAAITIKLLEQQAAGTVTLTGNVKVVAQLILLLFDGLAMRKAVAGVDIHVDVRPYLERIVSKILLDNAE